MPKMKSKKALTKRIKITGTGKLKRKCANMSHLAPIRSEKQKRHLSKARLVSKSDAKRLEPCIQK
ncbi:MAG: 50S ribosomal protein L35 [Erysipelotrichaceae bacterium]|nr:50S ribosomal protein L35 [Erysipelotrichaceae bacterium]